MKVTCDACGIEGKICANGPTDLKHAMPKRWRPRRIDGRIYNLCDICGNLSQFKGGLSAYLQELLGLPQCVEIDVPEHEDFSFWNPRLPEYSKIRDTRKLKR